MVQQEESLEHVSCSNEVDLAAQDKLPPAATKKTVLRDLQNVNRVTGPSPATDPLFSKNKGATNDVNKVSGIKRPAPECPVSPPLNQSPNSNAANGHLVYVRRKAEAEIAKGSTQNSTRINADNLNLKQTGNIEETNKSKYQTEPKVSSFPAIAPFPMSSPMSSSSKPSVPSPLGKSNPRMGPLEANSHPFSYVMPSWGDPKVFKSLPWKERFDHLQILLKKLDEPEQQEEYYQMLRSLSSVELSRLAIELERRSIQLSLEEAKEMQRVRDLNVLGKSTGTSPAPSIHPEGSGK